jgi:hypothetical protein
MKPANFLTDTVCAVGLLVAAFAHPLAVTPSAVAQTFPTRLPGIWYISDASPHMRVVANFDVQWLHGEEDTPRGRASLSASRTEQGYVLSEDLTFRITMYDCVLSSRSPEALPVRIAVKGILTNRPDQVTVNGRPFAFHADAQRPGWGYAWLHGGANRVRWQTEEVE